LEKLKKQDVCFPCFHGPFGEDGMIQGFLKIFNLKYVGSDYSSSAICMNKAWQKKVVKDFCIKIAEFYEIYKKDWIENKQTILKEIKKKFKKSSLFIKPANLGSSIGVFEVKDSQELIDKIEKAFKYSNQVLVEEKVIGQELEFAVLGTDFIKIAQPGEIVVKNGFYSFDKKYGNEIVTKISANVSQEKILEGFEIVKNIYKLLNCSGLARVDMFLDENQNFIFNEINTIPGLTKTSLFPKMFKNMEIDGKKLVDKLIISAIYRSNRIC